MDLIVKHRPAGYEAWKDETKWRPPDVGAILRILGMVFGAGAVFTILVIFAVLQFTQGGESPAPPLPTLVTLEQIMPTPTQPPSVIVAAAPLPTLTPTPTQAPQMTPDLQATLNYMLLQQQQLKATVTPAIEVQIAEPIFCNGAPFQNYTTDSLLRVVFEDKGALRVLDAPRNNNNPQVIKQLYNGDVVQITGDAVCGAWESAPVAYFPVYVPRWQIVGWVGFGRGGDVWLEPQN